MVFISSRACFFHRRARVVATARLWQISCVHCVILRTFVAAAFTIILKLIHQIFHSFVRVHLLYGIMGSVLQLVGQLIKKELYELDYKKALKNVSVHSFLTVRSLLTNTNAEISKAISPRTRKPNCL